MIDEATLHEAGTGSMLSVLCWMLNTKWRLNGAGVEGRGWRMEMSAPRGFAGQNWLHCCTEVRGLRGSLWPLVLVYVCFYIG